MMPTYNPETLRQLAAAGSSFYRSLLNDHMQYGALTAKQIQCIEERPISAPVQTPISARQVQSAAIEKAFETAIASGVKWPRLRLGEFEFTPAPKGGSNPGAVYIVDREDQYLGKVLRGHVDFRHYVDAKTRMDVVKAVNDPHAAAVAYGKRFGRCSVCARPLSNPESVKFSMGPICRQRFGW